MVNSIDGVSHSLFLLALSCSFPPSDFCLWAPPQPNSTIGDTEAIEVGWCSKTGWGTRLIPAGTLTGVQVLKTSKYIQFAGFINQVNLDMASDDYGGELDPHGADLVSIVFLPLANSLTGSITRVSVATHLVALCIPMLSAVVTTVPTNK